MRLGDGAVHPEVNFTLPIMTISDESWDEVRRQYDSMARSVLDRARTLHVQALMLEFEHLPPISERVDWAYDICHLLREILDEEYERSGMQTALRVTPVDLRYARKPPRLRGGEGWHQLREAFMTSAKAGADILSIESEGGKEVSDEALLMGDISGLMLALGVLAPRDMAWLWTQIGEICADHPGTVAGGDSACAFANTAMQLAHQGLIPETLAAVVRAASVARGLVAFETGASGPWKDCGYEGVFLKVITGYPISMEGKSATGAHFSHIGNVAAAACDLWSNESVQNVRLLSGSAPEAFTESLIYDCRLMNSALERGDEKTLRDLLVDSDRRLSPQAFVLTPAAAVEIATAVVNAESAYGQACDAARTAVSLIRSGLASGDLEILTSGETRWLDQMEDALRRLPASEEDLIDRMEPAYGHLYDKESYDL